MQRSNAERRQVPAADLHAGWDANAHMVPTGETWTRDTMLSFDGDAWLNAELEHRDLVFELSDYHQVTEGGWRWEGHKHADTVVKSEVVAS